MFPRLEYDLPILSMDMVGRSGSAISLAVIDPCPVSLNRSLPPQYYATVRSAREHSARSALRMPALITRLDSMSVFPLAAGCQHQNSTIVSLLALTQKSAGQRRPTLVVSKPRQR